MGKRDADSTAVNRRGSSSPSSNALTSNTRYPCVSVTRLSSVMNFCFGLVVIFLIFDVASVRSTDNDSSKRKKNSNEVQLSSGIVTNPFLQLSLNRSNIQNNPFLHPLIDNKNSNPFLSSAIASQASDIVFPDNQNYNLFPNSNTNPFLNPIKTDSRVDTDSSSSSVIETSYTTSSPTLIPNTPVSNIPTPNSRNDFTVTPPKIHPPISPSLEELLPIKINPVKTISELKCEEYVEKIAGTSLITSLTGSSSDVRKVINTCEGANRLIVHGIEAQMGEFPHMVALGIRNDKFTLMCGGSLISHTWVLSAAHCTYGPNGGPTHARIGIHSLTDQQGVTVAVKDVVRHPDYKPPAMYADLALIQLMNDVTFGTFIRPACLYQQYDTVPDQAWVSGWGVTEYSGDVSDLLQKAKLELIDNLLCTIRHNSSTEVPYGITPSMICAGDPRGNWTRDTCQGDSGGPLQIVHPKSECLFQVIGVTSFGQGCGMIDIPGVYTRVSHYLLWIEDNVWPQGQ